MTESSRVPRELKSEMTESTWVPRVLKSEMTESTWVPRVLKSEMTETSRGPFSSMYKVWNSNKSWMLSKSFVTFIFASRWMYPWYLVYTFLGSSSVFCSPITIIYRSSIFVCIRRTRYMRIVYTAAVPVPFLFPPPRNPTKENVSRGVVRLVFPVKRLVRAVNIIEN